MNHRPITAALLLAAAALITQPARAEETDAARAQRWKDLQHAIFGERPVADGAAVLKLDAPSRADDAALVPIGITANAGATGPGAIKGLYLVIDDNPSPLAAHFTFGPDADPHQLDLRVRVDQYTLVHAIAEMQDGKLYAVQRFVKAAGGCSAPAGTDEADALQGLGRMKLRVLGAGEPGKPAMAELLIRHPNFNGMQMNQVTRLYTPARFLDTIQVSYKRRAGVPSGQRHFAQHQPGDHLRLRAAGQRAAEGGGA